MPNNEVLMKLMALKGRGQNIMRDGPKSPIEESLCDLMDDLLNVLIEQNKTLCKCANDGK